jgi:hypothetical protein
VIVDAGEHIGEPGARIDVVELSGLKQGVHDGGTLSAAFGSREEPGFAAESDTAQGSFCRVVGQADATVVEDRVKASQRLSM